MRKWLVKIIAGLLLILSDSSSGLAFMAPGGQVGQMVLYKNLSAAESPRRLISLAPGITEIIFALGAGKQLVGVTDFCDYPAEAGKLPKIGGYYDVNFEAILSLKPDLVILLPEHQEQRRQLQYLHIPTLTVEMDSLAGVWTAYLQLGYLCNRQTQGFFLVKQLQQSLLAAREQTTRLAKKKVFIVINRDYSVRKPQEVYIAGRGGIYDELLYWVNAQNAYQRTTPKYPKMSMESLLAVKADVVVEIVPETEKIPVAVAELPGDWQELSRLAGRRISVKVLVGTYLVRPGPRLTQAIATLARAIHPEIK